MATYETNVNNNNNNNNYDDDNSSELSKENYSSSASSIDETKKISFEDKKEEKNLSSSKRNKRNSFISMFNPKKDDKEKEEKEKHSEGLVRSISGIFGNKDKDNSNKREGERQLRPTSRTSSNSDTSKNRRSFIFFSDDEEKPDVDTTITTKKGRKPRQSSNAEGLEKDKSSKKGKRISVNIGKLLGLDEKSSSQKSKNEWDDIFLEPDGTKITPKSPKSSSSHSSLKDKHNDDDLTNEYVESPQIIRRDNSIIGTRTDNNVNFSTKINQNVINTNDSPVDDFQSTFSSTQPSSVDDHYYNQEIFSNNNIINNKHETEYNSGSPTSPTTPITPKLIVTPIEPESSSFEFTNKSNVKEFEKVRQEQQDEKEDKIDQNNAINSIISTDNVKLNVTTDFRERKIDDTFTNSIEQQQQQRQQDTTTSQELDEINKSLNNVKEQLEAKVAEQNSQISKSMEQIMQQQIELSKRMSETMQRLESKAVSVQKDEFDSTSVSRIFEDTIKRLESKIDKQNDELNRLKSVVGQLGQLNGENQPFLVANGDISRLRITQGEDQNLIIAQQREGRALIQTQSPQIYSKRTLVSTLVVNPLCNTITVSASIATSVLYAVYVRPVVGLVGVLRNGISTNCETKE